MLGKKIFRTKQENLLETNFIILHLSFLDYNYTRFKTHLRYALSFIFSSTRISVLRIINWKQTNPRTPIISAARKDMIGSTLYLVGKDMETKELVKNATSCSMCKRLIINAGIEKVISRNTPEDYTVVYVRDWIYNDESIQSDKGE